jgi:hypothetical protein
MAESDTDRELLQKLDTIIAILQLAFREPIEQARRDILSDPVAAAIVDSAADWVDSGTLQDRVAEATKQSKRTVQRRIAALVSQRVLEQIGSGPRIRYRTTNLI